jgi:endonuclease IV
MAKFGIHISKHTILGDFKTLEDAVDTINSKYNLDICQVFTHGPQSRHKNNYNADILRSLNTKIYVHSTYLTDGYWSSVEKNSERSLHRYYKHIQEQLDATDEINGKGLVIHITRKKIPIIKEGMLLLQKNIKQPKNVKIILEFRAMKPNDDCSYETADRINKLYNELKSIKLNWGFCIDTSHMWATGVKMNDVKIISDWFRDIKCSSKIALFHLNASTNSTFGIGKDIHIIPLSKEDDIWGNLINIKTFDNNDLKKIKASSLGIILLWAKKHKVDIIGEFKRGTVAQYKFAIDVIKKILIK